MRVLALVGILAVLGCLDTAYLSLTHFSSTPLCGQDSGCGRVLQSPYSRVFGIPLSTLGLGMYLAIASLAWQGRRRELRRDRLRAIFLLSLAGNLPNPLLLYLQAVVIESWCPFCLTSAALIGGVCIVSLRDQISRNDLRPLVRAPRLRPHLRPFLASALLPSLVFVAAEQLTRPGESQAQGLDRTVVARIGGRVITRGEMDHALRVRLHQIERQAYEARREWLEEQLLAAEAERMNTTPRELIRANVWSRVSVTPQQIADFYRANRQLIAPETPPDVWRARIASHLRKQKFDAEMSRFLAGLRSRGDVVLSLSRPHRLHIEPNPRHGPETGSTNARLTVIEFSDFECPHCARAHRRLEEFVARHPDEVRVIFRHFPLERHENARGAAGTAACAQKQGRFWEYAGALFRNQRHLTEPELYAHAASAGLDVDALRRCVDSGEGKAIVEADLAEGRELGIRSTPSFFLNGQYHAGLPADDELESLLAE